MPTSGDAPDRPHPAAAAPGRTTDQTALVAVYGTLRRGQPNHPLLAVGHRSVHVADGWVRGRLYDLGPYPGLRPGRLVVHVEVYRLSDPDLLHDLDRLEGYRPDDQPGSEYLRRRTLVTARDGPGDTTTPLDAWIYELNRPVDGAHLLADGVWPPH